MGSLLLCRLSLCLWRARASLYWGCVLLSGCRPWALDAQAQNLQCPDVVALWHVARFDPGSEIKPMSPALAGRFFITEPPGKPSVHILICFFSFKINRSQCGELLFPKINFPLFILIIEPLPQSSPGQIATGLEPKLSSSPCGQAWPSGEMVFKGM